MLLVRNTTNIPKTYVMAKRIITKIGDIFCAPLDGKTKKCFQYITNDISQLDSSVIRVFKTSYTLGSTLDIDTIVNDKVDFYSHVVLRWGIEANLWHKVGSHMYIEKEDIFFRGVDHGTFEDESKSWRIYGKLEKKCSL